ncbi:hypothetical protein Areg01_82150 [Actinoplanes regularis]|nr:hypothetical protein Areg01_82150 [Actinoplanes regularis]
MGLHRVVAQVVMVGDPAVGEARRDQAQEVAGGAELLVEVTPVGRGTPYSRTAEWLGF